jgi:hypothetical protein
LDFGNRSVDRFCIIDVLRIVLPSPDLQSAKGRVGFGVQRDQRQFVHERHGRYLAVDKRGGLAGTVQSSPLVGMLDTQHAQRVAFPHHRRFALVLLRPGVGCSKS